MPPLARSTGCWSKPVSPSIASSRRERHSRNASWTSPRGWGSPHDHRRPRRPRAADHHPQAGMAVGALLTVVPMVIGYSVTVFLHATDAAHHGPGGGIDNLSGSIDVLQTLGAVAALLIGATLGAGDLGAGVFRELVVTGRSRIALYTARIPAGFVVLMAFVIAAFLIAAVGSVVFAGSLESPSAALLARCFGWVALTAITSLALGIGVASLIGSRSTSIGILLAWQLALSHLLLTFSF